MINNEHARISTRYLKNSHVSPGKICYLLHAYTVGYATTNECYDEQFFINKVRMLQQKHRCYNECGGILQAYVARAFYYGKFYCSFHKGNIVYAYNYFINQL